MKNIVERVGGLVMLKLSTRKQQRSLLIKPCKGYSCIDIEPEKEKTAKLVPEDVKKGYFAVTTVMGGEQKKFIVGLKHLSNPAFLKLLEQAKEEYGFHQQGVLAVPCQPEVLEKILQGATANTES